MMTMMTMKMMCPRRPYDDDDSLGGRLCPRPITLLPFHHWCNSNSTPGWIIGHITNGLKYFLSFFFLFIYTLGQQVNCHDYDKANILTIITKTLWYFHTIREWTVALSSTSWTTWGRVVSFHQAITLHIRKYLDIRQPSIPRFAYYLPIFSIYHPKVNTMKSWQLREWNHLVVGICQTTTGIWLNKTGIVASLTLCSYWHHQKSIKPLTG